jgi:hypothetical protein
MNQSTNFVGQHIFSQILSLASKQNILKATAEDNPNRYYKQLTIWQHFVSMMYCVLAGCTSLREIVVGLEAFEGKLNHIGLNKAMEIKTEVHPVSNTFINIYSLNARAVCRTAVLIPRYSKSYLHLTALFFNCSKLF